MEKALIALSGGVDSSVAAYLIKNQGFDCIGATMRLTEGADGNIADAKRIAENLGMPFYSFDFRSEFREKIIGEFAGSYEKGETPNPCVLCNRVMKFGLLMQKAEELGCKYLVTGHYAKIECINGRYLLKKADNAEKDQSYFLYSLSPEVLGKVLFPLGAYDKPKIREIAASLGFVTAQKKDSQDICFVPDGDYVRVIRDYTGKTPEPGNFVDMQGNIIGKHSGIINYTVGQRKGLGTAFGKPMYVIGKDSEKNEVVLSDNDALFIRNLTAHYVVMNGTGDGSFDCRARIRYRHAEQPARVTVKDGTASVIFAEPQRAITPGQSVVFYDGDTVLGGGIID